MLNSFPRVGGLSERSCACERGSGAYAERLSELKDTRGDERERATEWPGPFSKDTLAFCLLKNKLKMIDYDDDLFCRERAEGNPKFTLAR